MLLLAVLAIAIRHVSCTKRIDVNSGATILSGVISPRIETIRLVFLLEDEGQIFAHSRSNNNLFAFGITNSVVQLVLQSGSNVQTLTRRLSSSRSRYQEILITFPQSGTAVLSVNGGIPVQITLPRFQPLNNVDQGSITRIGAGRLFGFGQSATGCVRKLYINGRGINLDFLSSCPLRRVDECAREYCLFPETEECFKTTACDREISLNFQRRNIGSIVEFSSSSQWYLHGFNIQVTAPVSFQISLSTNASFYEENETPASFDLPVGNHRRFFMWPMISNRVFFHITSGSISRFRILGGRIDECQLQNDLPGRSWWKLAKTAISGPSTAFDLFRNYGVINDENQQARVSQNTLSYKSKLVDEWQSLNIRRVEVNIMRVTNGGPRLVYSAIYDGEGSSKLSWIANLLFVIVDIGNTPVTSWSELSTNFPGDIVEFHASTVNSTTELHFTRAGGRFRVQDISCLRDGIQADDPCADQCITDTNCQAFLIGTQGCCLLSSFNETIVGFLTQAEREQGIEEFDTIFQKTTQPPINVWPEGAFDSTEMERGFQCRFNGPLSEQRELNLHEAFNCEDGEIASTVVKCSERGSRGPRILLIYSNYGRTHSNRTCPELRNIPDVDCVSPMVSRFIESSCNGKQRCRIDLPLLKENYLGEQCDVNEAMFLDVQYRCEDISPAEAIDFSSLDSIRETPLRELYSDILHIVADPEGEELQKKSINDSISFIDAGFRLTISVIDPKIDEVAGSCRENVTACLAEEIKRTSWPTSYCGYINTSCPEGTVGTAFRVCGPNGWEMPDLSRCVSQSNPAAVIGTIVDDPDYSAAQLARLQADFLEPDHEIFGGDVATSILMIDTLLQLQKAELDETNDLGTINKKAVQFTENLGSAVSNLMDEKHLDAWEDIPKDQWAGRATQAIELLEEAGFLLAQQAFAKYNDSDRPEIIEVHSSYPNTALQVASVLPAGGDLPDEILFPNQTIPVLPENHWATESGEIWVPVDKSDQETTHQLVFAVYSNLDVLFGEEIEASFFSVDIDEEIDENVAFDEDTANSSTTLMTTPGITEGGNKTTCLVLNNGTERCTSNDESKPHLTLNSHIISATLRPPNNDFFQIKSVQGWFILLKHQQAAARDGAGQCVYWNTTALRWSAAGCNAIESNKTHTVCRCNHLTHFAILMDVNAVTAVMDAIDILVLTIITRIGLIVSVVALAMATFCFTFIPNMKNTRTIIHRNLSFSLLIAEIIFLLGIEYQEGESPAVCGVIAGFIHYSFLAAFSWMALEGIHLYLSLNQVFNVDNPDKMHYYYGFGYALPLIIVGITSLVKYDHYGDPERGHCWIKANEFMVWSFAGPVILVALINFVFLVSALRVVATHRKHSTRSASKLSTWSGWIKSSVVLLSLLGITWGLGVFFVNVETTFVAYLFTITNSLQGLFIFIFHCAMNEKLIIELSRLTKRSRFCPAFVQNRYDLRKWRPSSSSSQGTSSGTRRTISSKLSVNPSSSGLGVLDDTYFHSVTLPADQSNIGQEDLQPRKRTAISRKEPKWVRNSEQFNEEIDKTVGPTGMINKAFDEKIEESTVSPSVAMAGRISTMHLVEEQSAL